MLHRLTTALLALLAAVALAACGGGGDDAAGGDSGEAGGGQASASVAVTGTDALAFEPEQLTAAAGEITVELTAEEAVEHTFVVEDADGDSTVVEADAGATTSGTIELESGTYTFYCDVPGHREQGMEGTLEVQG